jgi:hypothetical protein
MPDDLRETADALVAAVNAAPRPLPPADLIVAVVLGGHRDADARAALWYLFDERRLRLTRDFEVAPGGKR